jgi:hypothetical protein
MPRCNGQNHAQVPVTVATITISYCHQCSAWSIYAGRITQHSDEDVQADEYVEDHLGPFDGVPTVLELSSGHLRALLNGPGLPWDSSHG